MSWYNKEQPTPFDELPIEGFYFLDGDILARRAHQRWSRGQKYPVVAFPSGEERPIWPTKDEEKMGLVHLFGELDLPYRENPDLAYEQAAAIAQACGYLVTRQSETSFEVWGQTPDEHLVIRYDPETYHMTDVISLQGEQWAAPVHPGHQLMTDEIRERLPGLYIGEEMGLEAVAPVKYFHVQSGWTWYASEYDPDDGLFFGLVDGFELELGYFSLAELQAIGEDGRTLPVERDLYYDPQTLQALMVHHRQLRGE